MRFSPGCMCCGEVCDPCQQYADSMNDETIPPWTAESGTWQARVDDTYTETTDAQLIYPATCQTPAHFRVQVVPTVLDLMTNRIIWLWEDTSNFWFAEFHNDGTDHIVSIYERVSGTDNLKATSTWPNSPDVDYIAVCYQFDKITAFIVNDTFLVAYTVYETTLPTAPSRFGLGKGSQGTAGYSFFQLSINDGTDPTCAPCTIPGDCGICTALHHATTQYLVTITGLAGCTDCTDGNISWLVTYISGFANYCLWESSTLNICTLDVKIVMEFTKSGSANNISVRLTEDVTDSPLSALARFLKTQTSAPAPFNCDEFDALDIPVTGGASACSDGTTPTCTITAIP